MHVQPSVSQRAARTYAGIRLQVGRDQISEVVPGALGELFTMLNEQDIAPAGPPLIRYHTVDYGTGEVDIDVGIPVQAVASNRGSIRFSEIPGGRFAAVTHEGHYDRLVDTTAALLDWGKKNGVVWEATESGDRTAWNVRVEHYLVGPPNQQDADKWRTEVAIKVAEGPSAS